MPIFEITTRRASPRKVKQQDSEKALQRLLEQHPSLLGHASRGKPRKIVWFWRYRNGPGDLWGMDDRGHLVIVEIKRALGGPQEKKAASQLRSARRKGRRFGPDDVQKRYETWRQDGQAADFRDEFRAVTGRRLYPKFENPYLYIVAGHYTKRGIKRVARHTHSCVMILAVPAGRGRTIVSTERIN